MAQTMITNNSVGAGTRFILASTSGVTIMGGVTVGSTNGTAIDGTGSNNAVQVFGHVWGASVGVFLGNSASPSVENSLTVAEGATVWGGTLAGVRLTGVNSHVVNNGSIGGDSAGISLSEEASDSLSTILNTGDIFGLGTGVRLTLSTGADATLTNMAAGRITGGDQALYIDCSNNSNVTVTNAGLIASDAGAEGVAIDTDSPARRITLVNTGVILGDILLNSSLDLIDNRGGSIKGDVVLAGGNDRYLGGAGNERVEGGAGRDALSGGGGADVFVYDKASHGRDRISGWQKADQFEIDASGFGGGLVVGQLAAGRFHAGATNRAQDANDRFIFRTTDATLWFDKDGKGGAGPVLIADLQAGAGVTAGDILLV